MKKTFIAVAISLGTIMASAQAIEQPKLSDNWSIGVQGGVTTPLSHHKFFESMRPVVGLTLDKQISPIFALGVEGQFAVNTSSWTGRTPSSTAFDDSYVGMYGAVDLCNLFGGFQPNRVFQLEAQAGAGWGHEYETAIKDHNYFATKAGLNLNFNVNPSLTLSLSPSVYYDMSDAGVAQSTAAYNVNKATFNVEAGVTYHIGGTQFNVVNPYNQLEIDALNGQINALRAELMATADVAANATARADQLANALQECQNRPATVIKETSSHNYLNSVRFVFFKIGSSAVTADQQPNVEMIADYLKSHPQATVMIKGYASKDGNLDFNIKLAQKRAESVKNMLINKYKVNPSRIKAEGEGIGQMFDEESWNRVSICTIDQPE